MTTRNEHQQNESITKRRMSAQVTDLSSEAFILRLFRQKNKEGFIKGLSDQPESFAGGFFRIEKVLVLPSPRSES